MMMKVIPTGDGSNTIYVSELDEHYHSTFGAITESRKVFIENGLRYMADRLSEISALPAGTDSHLPDSSNPDPYRLNLRAPVTLNLLEVGFGTGLNAMLSMIEAAKKEIRIHYDAIEPFPLPEKIWRSLNYSFPSDDACHMMVHEKLHQCEWNHLVRISGHFSLRKILKGIREFQPDPGKYHLVFFDAFGPEVQPEMWTVEVFRKIREGMRSGGVLVTYSVKGTVVRAFKGNGFQVEKLPGPPGKRHVLRALLP